MTGKFNPLEHKADFNQMWNKLTSYGQLNYFTEEDYITALTYILEYAYEALTSMTEESQIYSTTLTILPKFMAAKDQSTKTEQQLTISHDSKTNLLRFACTDL